MKLKLVVVGNRPPRWIEAGYLEYVKRLPREWRFELVSVPASRGAGGPTDEARRSLAHVDALAHCVALDELGKQWRTPELAAQLEQWQMNGKDVTFIVGGADGLGEPVRARADHVWSLSALTLPHALARVVVVEQLYRAWSVLSGHPYHRG